MKFKYSVAAGLLDTRGKMVKRPILELEIKNPHGRTVVVPAVIDSGADTTTLNRQYADFLGVDLSRAKEREIIGIGENKVPTHVSSFRFKIRQLDIEMEVPAWYVDSKHVNVLLGQEVFFEMFKIKFEKDHDMFEVTKSKNT